MAGIAVLVFFYGSAVFCTIAGLMMIVRYIRAPLHLHWELYRGSSIYELPEWRTKQHPGFSTQLKAIIWDILSLREYYQRNRPFWYFLFSFHFGLYLLILWHVWLFVAAGTMPGAKPVWGIVWGHTATALVFVGSVGILTKRILNKDLRLYYPPIHYAKWVFVIVALAGGFYAVFFYFGGDSASVLAYVNHQLAFELESKLRAPGATSAHLLIVAPWLIYLPFSHIMKLFLRYYHQLRWDHKPNLTGSDVEKQVIELLNKRVSWSAPHIQSGQKWGEVAVSLPNKTEAGVD